MRKYSNNHHPDRHDEDPMDDPIPGPVDPDQGVVPPLNPRDPVEVNYLS